MKYLLIDGNNLGCRASFVNKDLGISLVDYSKDFNPDDILKHGDRFPTGAFHGFFKTISSVQSLYPDRYICVVWDGKSKARITESRAAVEKGIVPMEYKENRKKSEMPEPLTNFYKQKSIIMSALSMTNIPQVIKPDEEADDIIASFADKLVGEDVMVLTTDKDYYQILGPNVRILTSDNRILDEEWFRKAYGIDPKRWVDVGALCGDDGDCIWGIPWVGIGTGVKEIVKHGTCEAAMESYKAEFGHLRDKFPDVDQDGIKVLKEAKTKDEKFIFPHVKQWMPFTGVALAYLNDKAKISRSALMSLIYQDRVPLAKSLKGMHRNVLVPSLPVDLGRDSEKEFSDLCDKYALNEVRSVARKICSRQM